MHVSTHARYLDYSTRSYQSKTDRRVDGKDPVPVEEVAQQTDDERRRREARQRQASDRRQDEPRKSPDAPAIPAPSAPRLKQATIATWSPVTPAFSTAALWTLIATDGDRPDVIEPVSIAPAKPPELTKPAEPASLHDLLALAVGKA